LTHEEYDKISLQSGKARRLNSGDTGSNLD